LLDLRSRGGESDIRMNAVWWSMPRHHAAQRTSPACPAGTHPEVADRGAVPRPPWP